MRTSQLKRQSKIQQIVEQKRNRKDKEFCTQVVVKKAGQDAPMSWRVDLRKIADVRLRRIILGSGTAPMPSYAYRQYGPLIFRDSTGQLIEYEFDEICEDETIEDYFERHYAAMKPFQIVSLPRESSFMTADVAHEWAFKLGFHISLEKIAEYLERHGHRGVKTLMLHTHTFFNDLCEGKLD